MVLEQIHKHGFHQVNSRKITFVISFCDHNPRSCCREIPYSKTIQVYKYYVFKHKPRFHDSANLRANESSLKSLFWTKESMNKSIDPVTEKYSIINSGLALGFLPLPENSNIINEPQIQRNDF